jgi:hypothetical protein
LWIFGIDEKYLKSSLISVTFFTGQSQSSPGYTFCNTAGKNRFISLLFFNIPFKLFWTFFVVEIDGGLQNDILG